MADYNYTPLKKKKSEVPSVFMTPSSSCGRAVYSAPKSFLTTSIPIILMTPLSTPDNIRYCSVGEEHKDILSSLYEYGVPTLANNIISLLDPSEIISCRLVCQTWNTYIFQEFPLVTKPQGVTVENLHPIQSMKFLTLRRPALAIINSNSLNKDRTVIQTKPPQEIIPKTTLKLRPCPQCQSPAKKLNRRRAECSKCCFDFCQDCLQRWHENPCESRRDDQLSPKKSQNSVCIAGSRKSKKRLKRL